MRRRHNRRRKNNQRKITILSIIGLLFIMVVGYSAFQTNLNINVKGNIVERSRVIQSWTGSSNEDFHTDYYRENIVSATFLDSNAVPSDAVESWDVSVDKDKGVMAYVITNTDDNTKYDLYIGANQGVIANENSGYLFNRFTALASMNFNNNYDTSNVINMQRMFCNCINLLYLDVSSFDTSNVTNMEYMFGGIISAGCMKLETLILGDNFNTSNVTNMTGMFGNLGSIEELDLNRFDTSKVTTMHDMFTQDYNLEKITFGSKFNTEKVNDMHGMFYYNQKLTQLDLCTFNTQNVTSMNLMFTETKALEKIKVGANWTTANATTTDMFSGSSVSEVTTGEC